MPVTRREFLAASGSLLAASAAPAAEAPAPWPRRLRVLILGGTVFLGPELVGAGPRGFLGRSSRSLLVVMVAVRVAILVITIAVSDDRPILDGD